MKAYKYMTADGGFRFLENWSLRITPSEDFNDPFELKPEAENMLPDKDVLGMYENGMEMLRKEIIKEFNKVFNKFLPESEISILASYAMVFENSKSQNDFLNKLENDFKGFSAKTFIESKKKIEPILKKLIKMVQDANNEDISTINNVFKDGFTNKLSSMIGILCLSRNYNQQLMWSHYAECHKGVMIEFDTKHPTFNRKRTDIDNFGWLRPVIYSGQRPRITMDSISQPHFFEPFAFTKSVAWHYEEELRMLWPLEQADFYVGDNKEIALISCPSSAVLSITLGCKATDETLNKIKNLLNSQPNTAHVKIRKAKLHKTDFALEYHPI